MHAISNFRTVSKQVLRILAIALLLTSWAIAFYPEKTYAADARWIDKVTIRVDNSNFVDDDPFNTGGDAFQFKGNKHSDTCYDNLKVTNFDEGGSSAQLQKYKVNADGDCETDGGEEAVTVGDTQNKDVTAYQIDKNTIFMPVAPNRDSVTFGQSRAYSTARNVTFKRLSNETEYCQKDDNISQADGIDKGLCTVFTRNRDVPAAGSSVWIEAKIPAVRHAYCPRVELGNCEIDGMNIVFANNREFTNPPEEAGYVINENADSGDNDGNIDEQPTCEQSGGLTWVICPVINGLADLADGVFNSFIKPLLLTKPVDTANTNSPTFRVWAAMRNIANILLVVAMIIIVFGQAIGGGLVDAYTAKKVLPRILAAAIMINLSIYMVALAIDVTNIIGGGITQLIYAPFGAQDFTLNITEGTAGLGLAGLLGAGGSIWIAAASGGVAALAGSMISWLALFVLLPLVLAFLGALFTLVIRQGIIQFLVISAPIACVLYCLPNTEKYFKKWWDLFFKTLLVYPIIMVIFAIADVLAVTITQSGDINGGTSEAAGEFVAIVLLALPLFLIPYAFKMAGGAITAIHGAITNSSGKLRQGVMGNPNDQDSLQNRTRRNAKVARTGAGLTWGMAGTHINPLNRVRPDGAARRQASLSAHKQRGLEIQRKQLEGTAMWQAVQGDSNVTGLLAHYNNAKDARAAIDAEHGTSGRKPNADKHTKMLAALAAAQQVGFNPASRRAALMNAYQVKFETPQGQYGWRQATDSMAAIAGGRIEGREVEELYEDASDPTKKTGERIINPGKFVGGDQFQFRSMMDEYQAVAKGAAGRADQAANINGDLDYNLEKATGSQSLYTLLNGHPNGVEGLINEHLDVMNGKTPGNKDMSATFLREMATASTKNQGTAGARDKINAKQKAMDDALSQYVNDRVSAMAAGPGLPTEKRQRQEVTTVDPLTGNQVTTTEVNTVPIVATSGATLTENRQAEAARRVLSDLDGKARSYTPMDPNNMET